MHEIVVTDGLVLGKRGVGEASVRVALLTRERGLLRATARTSRVEHSKLRYGLEPMTVARFSLVRGKYEWRLTGVEGASNLLKIADLRAARRTTLGRVSTLLLRLINGEEPVPGIFADVTQGFPSLVKAKEDPTADAIECVLVLRILSHLGYLPHTETLAPFVEGEFSLELSAKALQARGLLIKTINESLTASGL